MTGENLKKWRKHEQVSRYSMAQTLGLTVAEYRLMEEGERPTNIDYLQEDIAEIFGVNPEALEGPPPEEEEMSKAVVAAEPLCVISTGEVGESENAPERLQGQLGGTFDANAYCRVGFETGESIDVSEGNWKRRGVYVELPCTRDKLDLTAAEAVRNATRILGEEMEKIYLAEAEKFKKPAA